MRLRHTVDANEFIAPRAFPSSSLHHLRYAARCVSSLYPTRGYEFPEFPEFLEFLEFLEFHKIRAGE